MIRRLGVLWYGVLHRAHTWILYRVEGYCRRDMGRATRAKCRRDAGARLRQELAWQKAHLN